MSAIEFPDKVLPSAFLPHQIQDGDHLWHRSEPEQVKTAGRHMRNAALMALVAVASGLLLVALIVFS